MLQKLTYYNYTHPITKFFRYEYLTDFKNSLIKKLQIYKSYKSKSSLLFTRQKWLPEKPAFSLFYNSYSQFIVIIEMVLKPETNKYKFYLITNNNYLQDNDIDWYRITSDF